MRVKSFDWDGAEATARALRAWTAKHEFTMNVVGEVAGIELDVRGGTDASILRLTAEFDATESVPERLRVDSDEATAALAAVDPAVREAMELAVDNVRSVAEQQLGEVRRVELGQGQAVTLREVPVGAAGVYAPGGRAAYPSSVIMCCVPARVAGVGRIALASPPRADGRPHPLVLAAAALCGVDEIYAMGGAQAIFALARGTETIGAVDVVVGPGNAWVREAKRRVAGEVGIDSLAGPSELMLIAGHDTDPGWAALDLCAQAEHGEESPLVAVAVEEHVLDAIENATKEAAESRPSVADAPLALVQVPDVEAAIDLANAYAPEHLELLEEDASLLADRITTAGCVFVGRFGATAFGDYVAGSNHVLPTGGAGRFSGPLGPGVFRRRTSAVEVTERAAATLASHADALARAEGFPVHGESAMIRGKS